MQDSITVQSLTKVFKIYSNSWHRALEWMCYGKKSFHQDFDALTDISFTVEKGECFGIIGANGAGKSTLLKILTSALYPSSGTFFLNGKVLSLLELGTGFNPELTGRQNLFNSASLLGFPAHYISNRIDDIAEFAELGDFLDRQIRLYSSGMLVRLAFSMFVFMEPDILIIDEALSVGDVFFQQKCFDQIRKIIKSGTTCLFVSHDTAAVQNLCQRALLLDHGQIAFLGDADEAVSRYYATVIGRKERRGRQTESGSAVSCPVPETTKALSAPDVVMAHNVLPSDVSCHGAGGLEIIALRVTDENCRDTLVIGMEEQLFFTLLIKAHEDIFSPSAGIHLYDRLGNVVFAAGTRQLKISLPDLQKGDRLVVQLALNMNVSCGEYTFSVGTSEPAQGRNNVGYIHDRKEKLGPIMVNFAPDRMLPFHGIAKLPLSASFRKFDDRPAGEIV